VFAELPDFVFLYMWSWKLREILCAQSVLYSVPVMRLQSVVDESVEYIPYEIDEANLLYSLEKLIPLNIVSVMFLKVLHADVFNPSVPLNPLKPNS